MELTRGQLLAAVHTAAVKCHALERLKFGADIFSRIPQCTTSCIPIRWKVCSAMAGTKKPMLTDNFVESKPFSEIPGEKGLPFFGNLLSLPKQLKSPNAHVLIGENFKKFGPIYKVKMGPTFQMVWLNDINAIEKMLRMEGKYPRRVIVPAWRNWRDENSHKRGIFTEDGEDWKRMRVLLDKPMMRPHQVANYVDNFNEVVTDFVDRLLRIRSTDNTISEFDLELFHFSLETIGTVLYETRLGGLSDSKNPEMKEFIKAVRDVFQATEKVVYLPKWLNNIFLRKWQKRHDDGWAAVFRISTKLIQNKFREMSKKLERGEEVSGYLSSLLASGTMEEAEVYANISEMMLAAVDTTSNALQWMLNTLAEIPDVQTKLHEEVTSIVPIGAIPTRSDVQQMPYLKAFTKEVFRLYPVTGGLSRIMNKDTVLAGYQIPKNMTVSISSYVIARDPELFPEPEKFSPERWLRESGWDKMHSFAWLPFGYGPRMCIGRRVAELEIYLLMIRLVQNFRFEPAEEEPLRAVTRALLVPERSVNVHFISRTKILDGSNLF